MPFIPVPNGIKVCMRFTKAGQQCCNVFYVQGDGSPDVGVLQTIGGIFADQWVANLRDSTSSDTTLEAIEVTDVNAAGGAGIEYVTGLPNAGTDTSGALPNNVSLATKLLSGLTGRSHRGRFYMVGVPSGDLAADKQHVNSTLRTALTGFVQDLIGALATEGLQLAVASLYSGVDADHKPIPRAAGILTEVINATVNDTIDSQRRRLPERGS